MLANFTGPGVGDGDLVTVAISADKPASVGRNSQARGSRTSFDFAHNAKFRINHPDPGSVPIGDKNGFARWMHGDAKRPAVQVDPALYSGARGIQNRNVLAFRADDLCSTSIRCHSDPGGTAANRDGPDYLAPIEIDDRDVV